AEVFAGGAGPGREAAVATEAVLDEVVVVAGAERGPQDHILAAADLVIVLPEDAAVADFMDDEVAVAELAVDASVVLRMLKEPVTSLRTDVVDARGTVVVRHKDLRQADVLDHLEPRLIRRRLEPG